MASQTKHELDISKTSWKLSQHKLKKMFNYQTGYWRHAKKTWLSTTQRNGIRTSKMELIKMKTCPCGQNTTQEKAA